MKHQVAVDNLAAVDGEAGLKCLGLEEGVRRWRLPEGAKHLRVQPTTVARVRIDSVPAALPIVFGGRWDSVGLRSDLSRALRPSESVEFFCRASITSHSS